MDSGEEHEITPLQAQGVVESVGRTLAIHEPSCDFRLYRLDDSPRSSAAAAATDIRIPVSNSDTHTNLLV